MSAAQPESVVESHLENLDVDLIDPNEGNPRLIFPEDELERLAESIDQEGILVPIVVFPKGDRYVLVDGERRFKSALMLGHERVPALVTAERDEHDVLVQMFNIHLIREPWRDMPTARALGRLIEHLEQEGDDTSDRALRELTGLSVDRIRQLRYVLTLPQDWQDYIAEGRIPLNFFWELKRNVLDALARHRPTLLAELGPSEVAQAFVDKRLDGVISDTVGLRKVRPIINFAAGDAAEPDSPSPLDESIRELVREHDVTIDDIYEDTVQVMVEADKLERRTNAMLASFDRLLNKARTEEERAHILRIGELFVERLTERLESA